LARSPATRELTDKQRALIEAICHAAERGAEITREEAGTLAGYGQGDVARVQASRALALPYVQDELRQRMRTMALMDAPAALATLRHLRANGRGADRFASAAKLLDIAGVTTGEAQQGGMIAVQVVLPGDLGAILTQAAPRTAQVIDVEAESDGDNCRVEAVGGSRKVRDPSPRPAKPGRTAKGRGKKRRARSVARAPRTISSASGVVSGGETDGDAG
jgi:hypothetical protein